MRTVEERLGLAMRLGLTEGRWEDALTEVRLALIDDASSSSVSLALGVCYFHRRDFSETISWLNQAASRAERAMLAGTVDAPWGPIYLFRAVAYAARRLPAAARADFVSLRDHDPAPVNWASFEKLLLPDELTRAKVAAEAAGMPRE